MTMMIALNPSQATPRVKGDVSAVEFYLANNDGTAYNLAGYTVTFRMIAKDKSIKVDNAAGVVLDEPTGLVRYQFIAGDVDTVAVYSMYFTATRTADGFTRLFPFDGPKQLLDVVGEEPT